MLFYIAAAGDFFANYGFDKGENPLQIIVTEPENSKIFLPAAAIQNDSPPNPYGLPPRREGSVPEFQQITKIDQKSDSPLTPPQTGVFN